MLVELMAANAAFAVIKQTLSNGKKLQMLVRLSLNTLAQVKLLRRKQS